MSKRKVQEAASQKAKLENLGVIKGRILVIDDDDKLAAMLREYLQDNGFAVAVAGDGAGGLRQTLQNSFDAIVLDLMLPDIDGLDIFRTLRERYATPVLMLTAKGDPMDRVIGLELGADDYLPKPFEPRELLARLRAILRRGNASKSVNVARFGRLEVDRDAMEARLNGHPCNLTAYQFQLLDILSQGVGRVQTRDHLMNRLQGTDAESFDRSIDVHISRIRAEIEDNPKHPRRIITVRGAGYIFARSQD